MRYDYLKDLSHLREYMVQKDSNTMDFVDARFFEPTKDVDERT